MYVVRLNEYEAWYYTCIDTSDASKFLLENSE